ncbi:MAG: TonB-dependent receptor plug domain-containing protein [Burkholderiaceae bacterium]
MGFNSQLSGWPIFNVPFFHHKQPYKKFLGKRLPLVKKLLSKLFWVCLANATAQSCHAQMSQNDLANMSLEELVNIQITSVSKKSESLSDAAASVFVITNEDIHRAGVTNLPDALRLAPNLQVAQTSASDTSISARGFNSSSADKLLVLIDGRSVYTPLFSGVFWDVQDVMLEDIDRIEVISGPGGTLWGTNAVNGVINIMTKSAKDTQGGLVSIGAGNREGDAAFRYGGTIGEDGHYRFYGKFFDIKHTKTEDGTAKDDAWHKSQVGFRADWNRPSDQFSIQGNAYTGREGQPLPGTIVVSGQNFALGTIPVSGANLTTHWSHSLNDGSSFSVQAYYDRTERTVPPTFSEKLDILDLQVQHSLRPIGPHALIWGASYRYAMDNVTNSQYVAFLPAHLNQKWASLFAQDEITLRRDLKLTLGTRLEHNDYTGNEFLPNARLAWKLAPDHLVWGAVSRAVRAPSRLDHDTFVPGAPPFLLNGGSTVRSEIAKVFEVGYRGQPTSRISYSVTGYHTVYDHLRTQEVDPSQTFLTFANEMEGKSDGIETWATYQASANWRLSAGFAALRERLHLKPGSNDTSAPLQSGQDPAHSWLLRSSLELTAQSDLDVIVRHVSALSNPAVPKYTALDLHYGWRPRRDLELTVTGQNLLGNGHGEFSDPVTRTAIGRSIFVNVVHHF